MNHFSVLIRLLRDRRMFLEEVRSQRKLETKIVSLLIASTVFLSIYGAIVGAYGGGLQIISSAIKLPALYLMTLLICLPTLYFFDILSGSKLDFKQYATMALTAVSVISVLLFSFAPVILFFLISIQDYYFFLLLNVLIMGVTGTIGVRLFYKGMRDIVSDPATLTAKLTTKKLKSSTTKNVDLDEPESLETAAKGISGPAADSEKALESADKDSDIILPKAVDSAIEFKRLRRYLLQGWVLLYGLVGSQLGWTLRPFLGVEGEPFQVFRPEIDGNFYAQVFRSLGTMLGWH